jgi:hypothetical protein
MKPKNAPRSKLSRPYHHTARQSASSWKRHTGRLWPACRPRRDAGPVVMGGDRCAAIARLLVLLLSRRALVAEAGGRNGLVLLDMPPAAASRGHNRGADVIGGTDRPPTGAALVAACEARRDAIEHGERDDEGDATEPALPPPGTAERDALDARQRETVTGLLGAAAQRPPSWINPAALPSRGCRCSCCRGTPWWTEREGSKGWRCGRRYPPIHLHADKVRWAAVVMSSIKDTRPCLSP